MADGAGGPLAGLLANCGGVDREALAGGHTTCLRLVPDAAETEERESDTYYTVRGNQWQSLHKTFGSYPYATVGAQYSAVSETIFGDPLDAGKTMGLSPYGKPTPRAAGPATSG